MGSNIILTSHSLLGFVAKARRAGASVAVALLAVAAFPATSWNSASIEAQDDEGGPGCLTCTASCLDGDGTGRNCELEGDAAIGGNGCKVTINYDDPLGNGDGWYNCWCLYEDGFLPWPWPQPIGRNSKLKLSKRLLPAGCYQRTDSSTWRSTRVNW